MQGLWDTGAGLTAIDTAYVADHPGDFTFVKEVGNGRDATGNHVTVTLYKAKRISIGNHDFTDIEVLAIDLSVMREHVSRNLHMVIGANLITRADWFFDLKNRTWKLSYPR